MSSHHHLILFHLNVLNHHISSLHFFSAHSSSVTSLFFPSICSLPPTCFRATLSSSVCLFFSRKRSEGFSFNSWGSGGRALFAIRCFYVRNRPQPSATVRNRPQPSATVRGRALRRCHWGKLLQVTIHGCVTCQFAPLFHCDLHEKDMSRKQRDASRCTGAAFGEICRLLRSSIGISVWRVVFLGCWMWPCHWDLRFRVWHRSSVFVTSLS